MRRRTFLTAVGVTAVGTTLPTQTAAQSASTDIIRPLVFDSTASLLDATGRPLTDNSLVAVWAEQSAYNVDEDGDGNAVPYGDAPIPLVANDDGVVGFGAPIVSDETDFTKGNEEFVLNILDEEVGGGTVLFDYGHGQYYGPWRFEAFNNYAEDHGYTIEWTDTLTVDLAAADAAIITSPAEAFTPTELEALAAFVANGGVLLLFHQSDFGDYDETAHFNALAAAVGAGFRFNDDQVLDDEYNAGVPYVPITDEFNLAFEYFAEREGIGLELSRSETYTVDVIEMTDGDTFDVEFPEGYAATVRVLGIDTPEVPAASRFERVQEWEGLESLDYLGQQGLLASEFAAEELTDETVDLWFDPNEPLRDVYGRLLAYVGYDADGDGEREALYNNRAIAAGRARVYDSGLTRHDEFLHLEREVRAAGRGLWAQSDPRNSPPVRNEPVEELFFPRTASVRTASGPLGHRRTPVYAAPTATQELLGEGVRYEDEIPLVGVDRHAGVALVGSPFVDESYERAEGFPVDTSDYGNFPFLTNLIDRVSARDGPGRDRGRAVGRPNHPPRGHSDDEEGFLANMSEGDWFDAQTVLIDGGHGQFGADYALSAEDAAYYLRYLEGQDIGFEGINDLTRSHLGDARALLITAPTTAFSEDDLDAVRSFVSEGGAVVLFGSGNAPAVVREHLNAVAAALGSDLRLNADRVRDREHNVANNSTLPVTENFVRRFRLFDAYGSK